MKVFLFLTLYAAFIYGQGFVPQYIYHPYKFINEKKIELAVHGTGFSGNISEAFWVADKELARDEQIELLDKIKQVLLYFEDEVYPVFTDKIVGDPVINRKNNKIILLFYLGDEGVKGNFNRYYPAFVSSQYNKLYGRDIIVIDIDGLDEEAKKYLLVDELQHIFRHKFNKEEAYWLNEGLSEFCKYYVYNVFPYARLKEFENAWDRTLKSKFSFPNSMDYFNSFFFVYYLYQHYGGISVIRELIKSSYSGEANINFVLEQAKQLEKDDFKETFYNFKSAFLHYQISLLMNKYSRKVESSGFFDLDPLGDFPEYLRKFSVTPLNLLSDNKSEIAPWSAGYYFPEFRCFKMDYSKNMISFVVNMHAKDESKIFFPLRSGEKFCFEKSKLAGQYILTINASDSLAEFEIFEE